MRTVVGPTDRVVVVGAGLGGLSAALRLAAAGREVTVLERAAVPGGRAGRLELGGYGFDTGPTVLTMPELIADALGAVGERLEDWLELEPVDPAYRAYYPDGSTLDVHADVEAMAAEVERVCGPAEADGYRRFVDYVSALYRAEMRTFIDRNLDSPLGLLGPDLLRLLRLRGFGRLAPAVARLPEGPAHPAGLLLPGDVRRARPVRGAGDLRGDRLHGLGRRGVLPRAAACTRCRGRWPGRPRSTASGSGTAPRSPGSRSPAAGPGPCTPPTASGSRPTWSCSTPTCRSRTGTCCRRGPRRAGSGGCATRRPAWCCTPARPPRTPRSRTTTSTSAGPGGAPSTRSSGDGRLMSDPSLLVTNPTRTDPTLAPAGRQTYYVLAPTPNLTAGDRLGQRPARATATSWSPTLEARGYVGFGAGIEVERLVTPADWAASGLAAGAPFAAAHTLAQTGPFRPPHAGPRAGQRGLRRLGHPARRGRADGADLRAARGRAHHRPRPAAIGRVRRGR